MAAANSDSWGVLMAMSLGGGREGGRQGGNIGLQSYSAMLARRDDHLTVQPQGCAELTALGVSSQGPPRFSSLRLDGPVRGDDLCPPHDPQQFSRAN
jgi:hypothetical protein